MRLVMAGLDYQRAPIALREQLAFTKHGVEQCCSALYAKGQVAGCVLLSTCNRTELYVTLKEDTAFDPAQYLCHHVGLEYATFAQGFTLREGAEAVEHLLEVACGLQSQIWGDDQILTQVKEGVALSRGVKTTDAILETLFRIAISAGKAVKHQVRLTPVPTSAAHCGVEVLEGLMGNLEGACALVIGNGAMGRLSAQLLRDKGCKVTVTLRSYRHGVTVVPEGCATIPYEERYTAMEHMDMVLSATTSPHYTVTAEEMGQVACRPPYFIDLAIPRDIDPQAASFPHLTLHNVDTLGVPEERTNPLPPEVTTILREYGEEFYRWLTFKEGLQQEGERAHG